MKEKNESEKWTAEQKIKLIEAIEKHGENWDEILKVRLILIFSVLMVKLQNKTAFYNSYKCQLKKM